MGGILTNFASEDSPALSSAQHDSHSLFCPTKAQDRLSRLQSLFSDRGFGWPVFQPHIAIHHAGSPFCNLQHVVAQHATSYLLRLPTQICYFFLPSPPNVKQLS